MKKEILGLLIVLVLGISNLNAQGFNFEYYNPIDQTFTLKLEGWQVDQLFRDLDERKLLVDEVNSLYSLRDSLTYNIMDLTSSKENLLRLNKSLNKEQEYYLDIINSKNKIINSYDELRGDHKNMVRSLEWQLKKEKLKVRWYKIGTSVSVVTIIAILLRELTQN
jgi:hypothetical protein